MSGYLHKTSNIRYNLELVDELIEVCFVLLLKYQKKIAALTYTS